MLVHPVLDVIGDAESDLTWYLGIGYLAGILFVVVIALLSRRGGE